MSEIIQKWLAECIGVVISMKPDAFARDVMDGTVLAKVLYNYKIITQDQSISIVPTTNQSVAFQNLKKLKLYLNSHNIECSEDDFYQISLLNGSLAIRLFYQLYLELHDKSGLHFNFKRKANERLYPSDTRFEIVNVEEPPSLELNMPENELCEPLILRSDVIHWNQNRYQMLADQYYAMREKYTKYIQDKFALDQSFKPIKFKKGVTPPEYYEQLNSMVEQETPRYSYEELVEQQRNAVESASFQQDVNTAEKVLAAIKKKKRQAKKDTEARVFRQKFVLTRLWDRLIKDQEIYFEETISEKLLKQSVFEKQMMTKLLEVRYQKSNLLHSRQVIDEETMKRREQEFLAGAFLRNKSISQQKENYYFEKNRALELHQRLIDEKLRLEEERKLKICQDIMDDIIDICYRHYDYKMTYGEEPCRRVEREWENLFVKSQPIFDIMPSVADLVFGNNGDLDEETEAIYRKEFERQNNLDQADFENYLNYEWPWLLDELIEDYENDLVPIETGINVLGYAVHRALLAKYSHPIRPEKIDMEDIKVAACLNGLPDMTVLPILQKLLSKRKIRVIEFHEAINSCLDAYKNEIKKEYIDANLTKESKRAIDILEGTAEKPPLIKGEKGTLKPDSACSGDILDLPTHYEKECQTPIVFPCEEITLSRKGELGRIAFDTLNVGEQLPDALVVAMFAEFLRNLKDIEGWVLVNFPTNIVQAGLLEEALTGIPIPGMPNYIKLQINQSIDDMADLEYRQSEMQLEERFAILRKSKIVPDPDSPCYDPPYHTYLTAYINISYRKSVEEDDSSIKKEYDEEEEQLTEVPEWYEETDEKRMEEEEQTEKFIDPLEKFYADQDCNYAFLYKNFDVATIKYLAKLIIGDYNIPRKTSIELFGETVLYIQANLNQTGCPQSGKEAIAIKQLDKAHIVKKKVELEAELPADAVKIVAITFEEKETQFPDYMLLDFVPPPPPPDIKVGEPFWQYTNISFPKPVQLATALLWENIEKTYVCDFKELFFFKRIILNAVIPYLFYMKRHMNNYIARPDIKQTLLYAFQRRYNDIDPDMRDDDELKAEVHCRISEFQKTLYDICEEVRKESEVERQRLIRENWASIQLCEVGNNAIMAMQLEMDRCCDSLQFLIDYYSGMITKMPSDESPLEKSVLTKLDTSNVEELSNSPFGIAAIEQVSKIMTVVDSNSEDTVYHQLASASYESATSAVNKWKGTCSGLAGKMESLFKSGKKGKKEKKSPKKSLKKSPKKETAAKKKLPKVTDFEPDVIAAGPRIIQELNCAINGEALRAKQRLNLIMQRAYLDIDEVMNFTKAAFYSIHQNIWDRYHTDIENVNTICSVFAQATEAETPLQQELVIAGDIFYVDPDILLFPEPLPPPELPTCDYVERAMFTIENLKKLSTILKDLSSTGSIPERAFIFLLQDMITLKAEDGKESILPDLWLNLTEDQLLILSRDIFGDVEFIDWKDFIIYNYCIRFPTEEELIVLRQQFCSYDPDVTETVKDYQFNSVKLWFEDEDADSNKTCRNSLIKKHLFELFKLNDDTINYTAFLLAFCKDVNPIKGFAKALSLVLGKLVCWSPSDGNLYVKNVMEQRNLDYLAEEESEKDNFVSDIIEHYILENEHELKSQSATTDSHNVDHFNAEYIPVEQIYRNYRPRYVTTEKGSEMLLPEQSYSNLEIGYEEEYNPPRAYHLPFEAFLTVATAALPWHARAQTINNRSFRDRLEKLYKKYRNPDFNDAVLTHEILNDSYFVEMLTSNTKFSVKNPPNLVIKLVKYTGPVV